MSMKEITIKAPEGHEIDIENSDISKGNIVFKKINKLPESWEELGRLKDPWMIDSTGVSQITDKDDTALNVNNPESYLLFPTKEEAEASIALSQLCQLRDAYNREPLKDWCDWRNRQIMKYYIYCTHDNIKTCATEHQRRVLSFKTKELRDKFLSCPEIIKLINIAKPLL